MDVNSTRSDAYEIWSPRCAAVMSRADCRSCSPVTGRSLAREVLRTVQRTGYTELAVESRDGSRGRPRFGVTEYTARPYSSGERRQHAYVPYDGVWPRRSCRGRIAFSHADGWRSRHSKGDAAANAHADDRQGKDDDQGSEN